MIMIMSTLATHPIPPEEEEDSIPLCQVKKHHWHPRLWNSDGRYGWYLNGTIASNFRQLVEVVLCMELGSECRVANTMARHRTRCKQTYRRMWLRHVQGHIFRDAITVPSGCICQIIYWKYIHGTFM